MIPIVITILKTAPTTLNKMIPITIRMSIVNISISFTPSSKTTLVCEKNQEGDSINISSLLKKFLFEISEY